MLDTKILIVDDDHNICDLLKLYFENEGYEVKTANDGVECVSFFKIKGGFQWSVKIVNLCWMQTASSARNADNRWNLPL